MPSEQQETTHPLEILNTPLEPGRQSESLHNLFEAQVRKTPDAVSVVFEGQHLT